MRTILFICTANRCRSPMAEVLLKQQLLRVDDGGGWHVLSAGTWVPAGLPATELAQQVIAQRGLDLSGHRSRPLDGELLQSATVIIVMTRNQLEAIQVEFPETVGKAYLMSQLIGQDYDIEDPYGGSEADYQLCADEIERILADGFARLVELTDARVSVAP